ncbi:MAG: phosphate ABC transporter permease PstA [Elusimicrobiota bacterium]
MKKGNFKIKQKIFFFAVKFLFLTTALALLFLIFFIFLKGFSVVSFDFIFKMPQDSMTSGGIFPAIIGTLYLVILSVLFSALPAIACAVYLNEYAPKGFFAKAIQISINNLSGVPSVVFGLFGLSFFVKYMGLGVSLLSGALTLSIVILPIIISSSKEALSTVPQSIREASMALGATKWTTIYKIILPQAVPSILTAVIIGIGRAAGETAPILFTAAVFYTKELPKSLFSEVMALPYHIYALVTEGTHPEKQVPIAYGSSLILLFLVIAVSLSAIYLRQKHRSKYDKIRY